jgi:OOP family OmpA-OmpF porin
VNFKFDRPKKKETNIGPSLAEPTQDSLAILDQTVDTLKRYPQVRVLVAGHTDNVGTAEYNQSLSERRAKIVYDYLIAHGIDQSRLDPPVGYGLTKPIDTNDTAEGRARNRRTELDVQQ